MNVMDGETDNTTAKAVRQTWSENKLVSMTSLVQHDYREGDLGVPAVCYDG